MHFVLRLSGFGLAISHMMKTMKVVWSAMRENRIEYSFMRTILALGECATTQRHDFHRIRPGWCWWWVRWLMIGLNMHCENDFGAGRG